MAKHTRDSWGSLQYDAKRRKARIRYWAEGPDGYKRRSKTIRDVSRKEAEAVRAQLMLEHGEDAPCPTVRQAWERWALPDMERRVEDGDLSAATLAQYRRWWARHVEPTWGDVPCDQVRPLGVQQWISGLGLSQAKNAMPMLTKVMDYATRYEYVPSNPMREKYLMPSKSTVAQRDKGTWKLAELEGVWRKVSGTWMEPAFIVAAFGGARVGESLGPLAGEVELRDVGGVPVAIVPIMRQVPHSGAPTDSLKTDQSRRSVAIAGRAASALSSIAAPMPRDWFLTNDGMGGYVNQDRYYENWKKLGMEHPFRNLRNSWQTWMRWEMKVPPYYIEPMMGHVIKDTTGRYYDRPMADVFAEVVADAYRVNPYDADWSWVEECH